MNPRIAFQWLVTHPKFFPRLIGILCVLATLPLVLPGCASNPEGWESFPRWTALPPVYRVVDAARLQSLCPPGPGMITNGCAIRRDGLCFIYTEADPPQWLKTHEEKHCKGYWHQVQTATPLIWFTR